MTSTATTLELPQSVFEYLTQPNLQAAVQSVLDHGTKKLPSGLEWNELPQYFRAVLAASSVQVDWALAHEHLWRSVWPSLVEGWSPASLDEQSTRDFDANVSVEKCWSDEWLWRCFTKPSARGASTMRRRATSPDILYLGVSISLNGTCVGVSIEPSTAAAGPDAALFHFDDDAEAWRSVEQSITSQTLDLSELQQAARQALKWANPSANSIK